MGACTLRTWCGAKNTAGCCAFSPLFLSKPNLPQQVANRTQIVELLCNITDYNWKYDTPSSKNSYLMKSGNHTTGCMFSLEYLRKLSISTALVVQRYGKTTLRYFRENIHFVYVIGEKVPPGICFPWTLYSDREKHTLLVWVWVFYWDYTALNIIYTTLSSCNRIR